jgi:peroxiredoxin family protein
MGEESNTNTTTSISTDSSGWVNKAKVLIMLVNQVGIPSLIILFFFTFVGLTWLGKIPSPFVGKHDVDALQIKLDEHSAKNTEAHKSIMDQGRQNVEVLQEVKQSLKTVNCSMQTPDISKIKCFEKLNKTIE